MSIEHEIRAFFDEYEQRWNSKRFGALGELWDHDDTMPFYRPMEVDGYISQWKDLERYWEPKPGTSFIDDLNFRYTNLQPMCAYVEACMHPALYVKKLCDMTVRPSFVTTLRAAGKVKAPAAGTDTTAEYWPTGT